MSIAASVDEERPEPLLHGSRRSRYSANFSQINPASSLSDFPSVGRRHGPMPVVGGGFEHCDNAQAVADTETMLVFLP